MRSNLIKSCDCDASLAMTKQIATVTLFPLNCTCHYELCIAKRSNLIKNHEIATVVSLPRNDKFCYEYCTAKHNNLILRVITSKRGRSNLIKKCAFILAEVLINLGIIGVVAALTLNILVNNIRQTVLKNQFKTAYNLIVNSIEKTYSDIGYMPECSYGITSTGSGGLFGDCRMFHNQMFDNLKVVKYCPDNAFRNHCIADIKVHDKVAMSGDANLSEEDARARYASRGCMRETEIKTKNPAYVLENGTEIMIYKCSSMTGTIPIYIIDTNGMKGPNKWGYDVFDFIIRKNKLVCYTNTIEKGGIKCSDYAKYAK